MTPLKTPFLIQNTDQTSNIICQYETSVFVQIGTVTQKVCFFIMNGGKENTILGHPWLEAANPIINWRRGTVTIPPTYDHTLVLSFSHLAEHASYLSKNTCPIAINPRKETTLNSLEQEGLCQYLSVEPPEHFVKRAVELFIINHVQ